MREAIRQSLENLRANKLRSVLTMFGILWGIVSIVVLSAMGEGFRRGNDAVLREFGQNIGIVWGGRTSMQAGGERAGRVVRPDASTTRGRSSAQAPAASRRQPGDAPRRHPGEERATTPPPSACTASSRPTSRSAPSSSSRGRHLNWEDEREARRVALIGWEMSQQLFGAREPDRRGDARSTASASPSSGGCAARTRTAATAGPTTTRSSSPSR